MTRPPRYTVIVRGLEMMCSIGIRRIERERKQRVRISVEMTATAAATFPGQDRRNVINYEKVVAAIREIGESGHIDLCEGLAERICTACFVDPRVAHLRVTVEKPDVFPRPSRSARPLSEAARGDDRDRRCSASSISPRFVLRRRRLSRPCRGAGPAWRGIASRAAPMWSISAPRRAISRPGRCPPDEEIRRLDPIIAALAQSRYCRVGRQFSARNAALRAWRAGRLSE